ncbi:oxidoreductase, short chain dehydrogenase/reductase family [Coleofasciculus chthonoplastes PCC 7420]|uniref:Oxidoreductase, short chain dehydrogenase/reductase family n=1 Tax=Coleofasciculus chthonoplastes PCC 7420 TaxID=118168 RepID=B4VLD6_9CYAN|nr:SDR family oxidoreductase [Coleofasciculus chthonoplastes]EDX77377.1 oxidoreductase, short chain dehydrogenase/reductase family [Coleofasciculus chthonoplastes PCC 7420]
MDLGLKNRVALVCASSQGLGKAIAKSLAQEGAIVALCSRNPKTLEDTRQTLAAETQGKIIGVVADLSVKSDIERLLETVQTQLGAIDILVNNTGNPPAGCLSQLKDADWNNAYQLVLMSAIRLIKGVVSGMSDRGWGRVINIATSAVEQPRGDLLISTTFRAGLAAFSRAIAAELAEHNVLIHTVCPGVIATGAMLNLAENMAAATEISVETARDQLAFGVPMARMGTPAEVAALVTCLASDQLSYMTGQTITIDGGKLTVPLKSAYAEASRNLSQE